MDFQVGRAFGDYSITGLLGDEGMERVYKVEHRLTKRTEAMRLLAAEFATEIQIQRFEREMRVLARLNHPNIAVLHNALHAEKQLVIFTEFIDGQTLESILSAGRLPIDTGIGYIRQILYALRYAHQQGVVHRDVTPANVMVTAAGEVKLTDFGLFEVFRRPSAIQLRRDPGLVAIPGAGATQRDYTARHAFRPLLRWSYPLRASHRTKAIRCESPASSGADRLRGRASAAQSA